MMTTRIGLADDGGVVTIAPGGLVELALPENAGTGYRWALDPLPPGSELVEDRLERGALAVGPGAMATRVFVVSVTQPGLLSARLQREWETTAVRAFSIQIELE